MKPYIKLPVLLMIIFSSVVCVTLPCTAQQITPLLTESFETGSGSTPPSGWAIEQVTGTIPGITFVNSSANPVISTAFDGNKFARYNAFNISAGSTRLKFTNALSTTNHANVLVDFAWYEDPGSATSNDKVEVQWSVNGTTWNTAGTYYRYNATPGWKLKHQWLPAGANNSPTLYVAFLFTSANGYNCGLDLVHVTCATSPTSAVLSGYVRDINTQSPIAGAIVQVGPLRDTTMADGFYVIYSTTGTVSSVCTAGCYITHTEAMTLTAGTVTSANFMLIPLPSVTGTVTDGCTGAPIAGAEVYIGSAPFPVAMTNSTGKYFASCLSSVGVQMLYIIKTGYDQCDRMITLTPNDTTIVNAALLCSPVPPGNITAAFNNPANPTAINLSWTPPQGNYQLIYDDGSREDFSVWASAGNLSALRFTPLGWPVKVTGGKIDIGTVSDYPANALPLENFTMSVYTADGSGGAPGTVLDSVVVTPSGFGWVNFSFTTPITINSGDFYLVMKQGGIPPHACGTGIDTTAPQLRSWSKFVTGSGLWIPAAGNYMIRAMVQGAGGPVLLDNPTATPSYQVWRLVQGQENSPAMWTSVWTGAYTSAIDNAWPTLICDPYRWAVKAIYPPGSRYSSPVFSNVIGKCWTSTVIVQSTTDCGFCGKNINVTLQNMAYPDTIYHIYLDSLGHGQMAGIWKGDYLFQYAQFGCPTSSLALTIFNDTTTITFFIPGLKLPARDLSINDQSLLATWNAPYYQMDYFNETWSSGNFTANQWTVSGGSNWQISGTIGNPAPSARFSSSPQCTNCSQYLTSKTINIVQSPAVFLEYDISLNNYNTTYMNTMAVELWNGTNWIVLKTYDNLSGSIPWTSESLDITSLVPSNTFKFRFHASGVDTYSINSWGLDNIKVNAHDTAFTGPGCLLGYNVFLNNIQGAFVTDTFYHIPPNQVIYGHQYQLCVTAVYTGGYSTAVCDSFTSNFLYPPKNLVVTPLECTAHLAWEKPDDPVAVSALTGYDIYRNIAYIHNNSHPDSVTYDDQNLTPGLYLYGVTAKYDLGIYGFPGQTGESLVLLDTADATVHCGYPLPFHETFEQGSFGFHNWTFEPDQGNWGISTYEKSSAPFADFQWQPVRTNYSYAMVSDNIDAFNWNCAALWLDFDYKLIDHNATGNEKLKVEVWYDNNWHLLQVLSNNGSVDWTTLHFDLSAAAGKGLKVRFVAFGANSGDILHWYIDNINVYGICTPPSALSFSMNGQIANLSWTAPACSGSAGPAGYNVYRTDSTGLPPFTLRNQNLVTGTSYSDDTGPGIGGTYYYYVTAVSDDPSSPMPLCESAGSDTIAISTVALPEKWNAGPRVYPNPATGLVHVVSDRKIEVVQILNYRGQTVALHREPGIYCFSLDVSEFLAGVYFFRITDQQAVKTIKVIIVR
jgi:hypothetical protein